MLCNYFCTLFVSLIFACGFVSASDDQIFDVAPVQQNKIIKIFNDPRVVKVVEKAEKEGHSVTVNFAVSETAATSQDDPKPKTKQRWLGAMLDAGVPQIVGGSVVVRPWRWLRTQAGVTYDTASLGIRGGVTVMTPFDSWINLSATGEAGYVSRGDLGWITRTFMNDSGPISSALKSVSYDYVTGEVGIELGAPNSFIFFIHGGISYVNASFNNADAALKEATHSQNVSIQGARASYFGPTGKIGFILYFL